MRNASSITLVGSMVLALGCTSPVPLTVLEDQIDGYIERTKGAQ